MITFTELGNKGRLGKQLFQLATLLSISQEKGYLVKIPDYRNRIDNGQNCLLDYFNIDENMKFLSPEEELQIQYDYSESTLPFGNYIYSSDVFGIPDFTNIRGYFNNYKYIEKHEDYIIAQLTPKSEILNKNLEIMQGIKSIYNGYKIASLHVRRGPNRNFMYNTMNDNILDTNSNWYSYFLQSKRFLEGEKVKFMVFTSGTNPENNNEDYNWCMRNLNSEDFIYYGYDRSTINDFCMMLLCDHHVLAPSSTLSWWVGFLNKRKRNKIVIAPREFYFLNEEPIIDYYPPTFKKIDKYIKYK
jgi:hypothetical protein